MKPGPRIAVVVGTYRRHHLLKKGIRRLRAQTYQNWALTVVHDGADAATRAMVEAMAAEDSRIRYLETPERGNNYGVTPRIFGVTRVVEEQSADYVVFWDDDFYCYKSALQTIVDRVREAGEPDLLLAPIKQRREIAPKPGVPIEALARTQLDIACIVTRPALAARHYPEVYEDRRSSGNFYCEDFELFDRIRKSNPRPRMVAPGGKTIGIYNGMNYHEWLVSNLPWLKFPAGLGPFALHRRFLDTRAKRSEQPGT